MKRTDLYVLLGVVIFFAPFFLLDGLTAQYSRINEAYPLLMSFLKFAVLATFGETLGLRIREGIYNYKGFGLIPRAIIWGVIGVTIKLAFVVFDNGMQVFMEEVAGICGATQFSTMEMGLTKILIALSISIPLNVIYAPVMMTMHKITDTHIMDNQGTVRGLFKPIKLAEISQRINWDVQWNFVFKKTIPYFWIPAHTITFLLPPQARILFAALLGIALGVILAVASLKGRGK